MSPQFFENQMKILIADFGPAEYTTMKTKIIWEFCHHLPERNFAYIIRHFLETKSVKYPPLPTHFREAAMEQEKIIRGEASFQKINQAEEISMEHAAEGMRSYLKSIGAESIIDAIQKNKEPSQI